MGDRRRHHRLRALFPRGYATDPGDSALGVLLETLGDRLSDIDRDLERALRDRWVATAVGGPRDLQLSIAPGLEADDRWLGTATPSDATPGSGEPAAARQETPLSLPTVDLGGAPLPLELLGATLDLLRQPWEVDPSSYRSRIRILAPLLTRGLGTPRALVAFALTSLGSEPCPMLERRADSTMGWGVAPGALARCRVCQGGRRPPLGTSCPLRWRATMDVTLTEQRAYFRLRMPRTAAVKAVLALGAADYMRALIDRVRPAGVRAELDFVEPPFREQLDPADALPSVQVRGRESVEPEAELHAVETSLPAEALSPEDAAGFLAICDVTRFDISRLAEPTVQPGPAP